VSVAPYRVLFPLGILFAMVGAVLWPLHAAHLIPYPVPLHPRLMIQGFEHCFILGFLLTAMPSFLHAARASARELGVALAAMAGFLVCALAGVWVVAEALYLVTLLLILTMAARRFRTAQPPPEEFLFVGAGLVMGLVGGTLELLSEAGVWTEPAPRFGLHVIGFGMVLSIVLGVGGLLVPTFTSMREPLVIPGLARPHERLPRRGLYAVLLCALVGSLVLEATRHPAAAVRLRAAAGTVLLLWVWKLFRMPGARDRLSYSLWIAGWMLLAGLWIAALFPFRALPGFHVLFIGGMGLLTAGIATRVTVRHGGHPIAVESRVLRLAVPALLLLALLMRLVAETSPERALLWLSASALLWIVGWIVWGGGAIRYLRNVREPSPAARVPLKVPNVSATR
jgi:uncharacterized protein involved in response to NO